MRFGMVAAAAAALVCAGQADATTVLIEFAPYVSTLSAFSFEVEMRPEVIASDGFGFRTAIFNGTGSYKGVTVEGFYTASIGGGFGDYRSAQLFSGSTIQPLISTGSFVAVTGLPLYDAGKLTLTALPEPGSWLLMIGGIGIMGAALRRRKVTFAVTQN